jgi:hypothetical protein
MPNTLKDGYSNFAFFQAFLPFATTDPIGAGHDGISIDTKGYETCTFIFNIGAATGGGAWAADDFFQLQLEHYNSVAAAWSECYPSQMIHSVIGEAGAYSALNSGIFQSIASETDCSTLYRVGYIGPHRFVRVGISAELTPSIISVAAICICGLPRNWPVNTPVGYP